MNEPMAIQGAAFVPQHFELVPALVQTNMICNALFFHSAHRKPILASILLK